MSGIERGARSADVVLLTGSSLCHNPRVLKEAAALAGAGYRVCVLGAWLDAGFKRRDLRLLGELSFDYVAVLDVTLPGALPRAAHLLRRARGRAAGLSYRVAGHQSLSQLGPAVGPLFAAALRTPADLYIAHSEPGLYVARELACRGRRVAADMEDWFSEDLLPDARRERPRPLLQSLERDVLAAGICAFCPSQAMAGALAREYGCAPACVIYNAFPWADRRRLDGAVRDRRDRSLASIYWFSTTIGPGRGLETLFAALPLVTSEAELHLRGSVAPGFAAFAAARIPAGWRDRVFFHPPVDNDELLPRIAEHDIGFAGEVPHCRNRDLTVTNKLLHYLLGGLAVVASDTTGQREIVDRVPSGVLGYAPDDPAALAAALNRLLGSPERLRQAKAASLAAAERTFCWERQEPVLLRAIAEATARERILAQPQLRAAFG